MIPIVPLLLSGRGGPTRIGDDEEIAIHGPRCSGSPASRWRLDCRNAIGPKMSAATPRYMRSSIAAIPEANEAIAWMLVPGRAGAGRSRVASGIRPGHGRLQCGQDGASEETSFPQPGHFAGGIPR